MPQGRQPSSDHILLILTVSLKCLAQCLAHSKCLLNKSRLNGMSVQSYTVKPQAGFPGV